MRWMMDTCRGKLHKDVSLHTDTGNLPQNAWICAVKSILVSCVDCWRTFITNCEEVHNNLSNLNCRSHIVENCIAAMTRGLRQALTRIAVCRRLESGPSVEEPCPAEMAGYDHVYHDSVTGASLPSKCVSKQCSWKYQAHERDEYVHSLRARSRERARTHSGWDALGLQEHLFHLGQTGCSGDEENDEDGFDGTRL